MDLDKLRKQLAREANDYLRDLREIIDSLKRVEGWIALGLVVAVIFVTAMFFLNSLGFSPPNEHVIRFMRQLGMRPCRPISNIGGSVIFISMLLMIFLSAITLGNMINLISRVNRGEPREPRDLIVSTSLMLAIGGGSIIYMRWIC
jgi:amino acid transporter